MKASLHLKSLVAALACTALLSACAGQSGGEYGAPGVGSNELGGLVTSANGPEAGVWVIAETRDLPTRFARIVVTNDRGRYLMPDLPKARYEVWVRGYGLVDSPKVQAHPGQALDLKAVIAPSVAAAPVRIHDRSESVRNSDKPTKSARPIGTR